MRQSLYIIRYLILMSAFVTGPATPGERTFKWVDEAGNIHYGDRVPPQYSNQERKVINPQGRIVKIYEAPKTPEQKAEEQRLAAIEAEEQKRRAAQALRDRTLLATYSSEQRLVMARDGKIVAVKATIQLAHDRLKSLQKHIVERTEEAAEYERSGKPIPVNLQNQIASIREQISKNEAFVLDKQKEMVVIREQFDSDIQRFHELTSDEKPTHTEEKPVRPVVPVIPPTEITKTQPPPPAARPARIKPRVNPEIQLTRHDRTLLATYPSEDHLLRARDEALAPVNFSLQQLNSQNDSLQLRLARLSDNADEYERVDEILPENLVEEMKNVLGQISQNEQLIVPKLAEKNEIEQKYADDLFRYRELTVYE